MDYYTILKRFISSSNLYNSVVKIWWIFTKKCVKILSYYISEEAIFMSKNCVTADFVVSGYNAVTKNAERLNEFGKKCIIITGGTGAVKSGALSDVIASLEKIKTDYVIYDKIRENPTTASCFEAGNAAREFEAEFVIGIGGGSPLDAAKAVAVYASNPQISSPDLIYTEAVINKPLSVVLIGTTAGTGSEVTGVSVLTNEKGKKKSVKGENYYASLVFADAKYTYSLPYSVTVSTALDALAHAVESHLCNKSTKQSREYSSEAIGIIYGELKKLAGSKELPDNSSRQKLYYASLLAGNAINLTGTGFPHAVGYYLTEKHDIPHGRACAVFMSEYVKRGLEFNTERTNEILEIMNVGFDEFSRLITALSDVRVNVDENELEKYLANWEKVANFDNSPGGFDREKARELLLKL